MKRNIFDFTAVRVAVGLCLALAAESNAPAADLPKGLVLFFNFNEADNGGVIIDRSGQRNNGRATGLRWTTGKQGGCYEFSPANSYIHVANNMSLNANRATFAAWFKAAKADAIWRRILDKRTYTLCIAGDSQDGSNKGKLAVGLNGRFWCLSDSAVADGKWHHGAATYDGANLKLYVDGQLQKQVVPMPGAIAPNANDLTIGMNRSNPSAQENGQSFDGMIDEVMIFNRALSAEEIKTVASAGSGGTAAAGKGKTFTKAQVARRLVELKDLLDKGYITQEFYEKKVEECKPTE